MSVGVVAALNAEARTWRMASRRGAELFETRDGTLVASSGIGGVAATAAASRLADAGATALLSWGLAGGLDPALCAGTLCVPATVLGTDGRRFSTDSAWREGVGAALATRPVVGGALLASAQTLATVAAKEAAFRRTGAAAVDMESAAVAAVAASRRLPLLVVRVIVDTALDAIPAAVLAATRGGEVRLGPLLQSLSRAPREVAALLRLARRYRIAMRVLTTVARSGALALPGLDSAAMKPMT